MIKNLILVITLSLHYELRHFHGVSRCKYTVLPLPFFLLGYDCIIIYQFGPLKG